MELSHVENISESPIGGLMTVGMCGYVSECVMDVVVVLLISVKLRPGR